MTVSDLRSKVASANLAIDAAGLVILSFGNVSAVDREAGLLLIKPSGVAYDLLSGENMVAVSLLDGGVMVGSLRPSMDTPTHRLLYLEFPEINAIVHTHSPYATAWAQAGRPIPCLGTTHADYFRGSVPVSRSLRGDEISGDYEWETGRAISDGLRMAGRAPTDSPAILVQSHGVFTWGSSLAKAVEAAVAVEAIAEMAFRTLAIAPAAGPIDNDLLARHFDRKHGLDAYYGQPLDEFGRGSG